MAQAISDKHMSAYKVALKRYGNRQAVTAVDIGYKYKQGEKQSSIVVRVHVKEKIPESALLASERLPESIEGVPLDVIEAVYEPQSRATGTVTTENCGDRTVPAGTMVPGISVSRKHIGAGTIGAFVKDNKNNGRLAILSNWHVLAGFDGAEADDPIVQPGSTDGGRASRHTVATLERMDKENDAAIALLNGKRPFSPFVCETDVFFKGLSDPSMDDVLVKSGRTTGVTSAQVEGFGQYKISYYEGGIEVVRAIDGFRLEAIKEGTRNCEEIASEGDSGSIWYDEGSQHAVGLLCSGEKYADPSKKFVIASYVTRVFERLDISLPTPSSFQSASHAEFVPQIASGLGSEVIEEIVRTVSSSGLKRAAKKFLANQTEVFDLDGASKELDDPNVMDASAAAAIGFATGAAITLLGKDTNSKTGSNPEDPHLVSMVASAFLLGAAAGSRENDKQLK